MKKLVSVLGFAVGVFALTLQLYLILSNAYRDQVSYVSEVIRFFSYMTIWTNIFVTLCFGSIAIFRKTKWGSYFSQPFVQAAAFIYILVVGVAYHFLLAKIWSPTGLQYMADILLHYGVPALYILFWIFLAEKKFLNYKYSFIWLIYPFVYFIYSLIRGEITSAYPYPFVDVNALGYSKVFANSLGLLVVYTLFGFLTILFSRQASKTMNK
jgi:hypothetical protein